MFWFFFGSGVVVERFKNCTHVKLVGKSRTMVGVARIYGQPLHRSSTIATKEARRRRFYPLTDAVKENALADSLDGQTWGHGLKIPVIWKTPGHIIEIS